MPVGSQLNLSLNTSSRESDIYSRSGLRWFLFKAAVFDKFSIRHWAVFYCIAWYNSCVNLRLNP